MNDSPKDETTRPAAALATGDSSRMLESVVGPVVETMGFELCHLEWAAQPGRRILRVYLDHEQGVTLADCARLNRIVSNALDAAELAPSAGAIARLLASQYTLEVSSPGIERPISKLSHFRRFSGRRATVRTHEPLLEGNKQRTFHGHIESTEPDPMSPEDDREGVVLIRDEDGTIHRIGLHQIRGANLVYDADSEV